LIDLRDVPNADEFEAEECESPEYDRESARSLRIDNDHRESHVKLSKQRLDHLSQAISLATGVVCGLASYLGFMSLAIVLWCDNGISPNAQAVIVTAPIAAMSLITVFVLRGVFVGIPAKEEFGGPFVEVAKSAINGTQQS